MRKILQHQEASEHYLMKIKLLRNARITHKSGEIVEVSPEECKFLCSVGSAVEVAVKAPEAVETATIKRTKTSKK
jgi:hypothetical protein